MIPKPKSRGPRGDRYDPYDSDCYAAIRGKDLIYSGDVDNRLLVFLWDNILKAGIRLDKDAAKAREGRRFFMNSLGGDVYVMASIVDLFEEVDDLTTVATGCCMSAAVPIVAAGTPGKRFATHRTRFMFHPNWELYEHPVKLADIESEKEEFEAAEDTYAKIMYRYCNHKLAWWTKTLKKQNNWYFNAQQALELGIIDHIIPDLMRGKVRRKK